MRKALGVLVANIMAVTMIAIFLYNSISYLGIWYKIKKASKTSASTDQKKYHRSAQTMLFFVAAFIGQWWVFIIFNVWSFFASPHYVIVFAVVIFANMGGVFNFLAYSYVRKRQASVHSQTSQEAKTVPSSARAT